MLSDPDICLPDPDILLPDPDTFLQQTRIVKNKNKTKYYSFEITLDIFVPLFVHISLKTPLKPIQF